VARTACGALASLTLVACGTFHPASTVGTTTDATRESGSAEARAGKNAPLGAPTCRYRRGQLAADTLPAGTRVGDAIPLQHIIVLMQENRSFDSYLGHLQAYEASHGQTNTIESPPDGAANPTFPASLAGTDAALPVDAGPDVHPWAHAPFLCFADTGHTWGPARMEYDDGKNDGFYFISAQTRVRAANPEYASPDRAMWFYDERDIPFYYELYSRFAMADHYFSDVLGPTFPNRAYLYAATSFGETGDQPVSLAPYPYPNAQRAPWLIFDALEYANVSWRIYADEGAGVSVPFPGWVLTRYGPKLTTPTSQFMTDAANGTLPSVSFVDPNFGPLPPNNDQEHPPGDIAVGQHFVWTVVDALMRGPSWKDSALLITYDENGGLYDHVPPPAACAPGDLPPHIRFDAGLGRGFDQYGFRVPMVAVSPYAKRGYVSHRTYSHASITRFIEARFGLGALTRRDANADDLDDLFDWSSPPRLKTPPFDEPVVDATALTGCEQALGVDGG
jgi:phospholipase C